MLTQTILNKCYKFKSFIYGACRFDKKDRLIVTLLPRKNGKPICSSCGTPAPLYDKLKKRYFEFIPIWGMKMYFEYIMRRVQCDNCGIKVERVPWAKGKNTSTIPLILVLANWSKSLSWKETARRFNVSWGKVFRAVEYVVDWGLKKRELSDITAIGIDEISWRVGHTYLTLVYQIDAGFQRLLWIGEGRGVLTLYNFFGLLGREKSKKLKYICSDLWRPYLQVIEAAASQAVHIIDRFHIIQKINKAIDEVRAEEHRQMRIDGHEAVLTNSRWCFLKRPENLTEKQEVKLAELLKYNLKSVRAYLLKEDFDALWSYITVGWAGRFIDRWVTRVMRSKIGPMKKVAKMIRKHKPLILNWFKAKEVMSCGVVEGMNNKIKVTMKNAYGYRTLKCIKIALYHAMGQLPEPELTHRFC
jgi:transposase